MFNLENLISHAIDKEICVTQQILRTLDAHKVSLQEWDRILPILTSIIEEQIGEKYIRYKGELS